NYVSHILRNSTKKLRKILATDDLKESQREVALAQRRSDDGVRGSDDISVVDGQTRLYNRSYFESRLIEEINRGSRHEFPVAVMLVRLEGHSQISRAYGTIRSEEVFRTAAYILADTVRRADIVTRYDSQTFGLILPHTGNNVKSVSDRIRN